MQNMITDHPIKKERIRMIVLAAVFALLISAVLCLTAYFKYKQTYLNPYTQFREMEFRALPQFDKLNEEIYEKLPKPPSTFNFLEKTSYGIDSPWYMGRWMTVSFLGPEEAENEFFKYYGTNLLNSNWVLLKEENDGQIQQSIYYKETSCIRLSISVARPGVYFISIWQDFENQAFISNIPSDDVICDYLYDSWIVAKCP